MMKRIFIFFIFFIFLFNIRFTIPRKICSVVQFGNHTLLTNKNSNKIYKHKVVGVIDPFDKNNVLWMRKKRNKKFNLNIFKKLYDKFYCNINDYVDFPNEDEFMFRIFHINLKNTIKYMLKYKIVSGTIKNGPNNDNNILCLKERSKLYRFLNNVNI
ncbi:conserved Plasmodium protein, unknown function [Plasmodium berghei]|uniref:Uncharacterized protein n=2 Tax=Plasmodium berghei TaxID=5821 RepID=A0A509AK45_PLABA|nr:conserved Plasmodium protein, unknown function [Plasmodium berghei ANKA]CXI42805.1 conserved Plasmodium protein, unknown function [Plasmodium berghei]SCM22188.1 conserved Plasmodium protein, unknown function [Plasmodium berghei]SCN25326.1 conserved Plasmodium protein, unknown function [Plasmodium berghei]SCO60297.1 conserved Plasmodium protein, unknown function [Plasmodium berghei]SCO61986.1 conserved Plasmodium protein, unknown function [Plasmodium berghei]|eukprot:XP_034421560.1 conserved Plasmodium protein, unknown function [Plasmodium berghei ANKA]